MGGWARKAEATEPEGLGRTRLTGTYREESEPDPEEDSAA